MLRDRRKAEEDDTQRMNACTATTCVMRIDERLFITRGVR